ncbi:MAG: hypothetical protein Q8M07_11210, partial [Prosthecobacter sp.]|nr:hypothetical protein [Prosthecobacter sp.]
DVSDSPVAAVQTTPAPADEYPPSAGPPLDSTKWLPFTHPGDFGKVDGGVTSTDDGAVTVVGGMGRRLRTTWTHQDLAVRARITLPSDGIGIIGLRTDMNKPALRAAIHPDRIDIVSETREDASTSDHRVLRSFPGTSGPFYEKEGAELTFAVLGSECSLWLGRSFLGSATDTTATAGKALFDGENATFRDMQWQVIGDTSAPVTPAPPALKAEDITGVWPRPGNSSLCVLYPDGKITLINQAGQEDRRADGTPYWTGWRWRIEADKAHLSTADGKLQEEWSITQPGVVSIKHIVKGSTSTSRRVSTIIPTIRPTPPPVVASKPAPQMPAPKTAIPSLKAQIPAELLALQTDYAASIASRVTTPHDSSLAQLNTGFTAALDRAVASQQLPASAILADKQAIASKQPLPPDTDTTPDVLKTYRATYRAKASEIDDTRTTAHLGLLTPFVAKLRELETILGKAGRTADAAAVTAYRDALSENPLALPEAKP